MRDFYLAAPDEQALIDALPTLRTTDRDGNACWITASNLHALDPGIAIEKRPVEIGKKGKVVKAAVMADGYFANLRLSPQSVDYDRIVAAVAPFVVEPATPQRVFG